MALKIIHCADIHFDSVMSGIKDPKKVNIRREDLKKTFQNIIALAHDTDVLLISGDLFDAKKVSKSTLEFLKEEFLKLGDVKVFIVAGNHDPLTETSVYKTFDFGKNVHIFGTQMECVELPDCDVYGVSFKTANDERELLSNFCVKSPDKVNICLMHGNLSGSDYNPIKITDIEKSGLDYLALGHVHKSSEIKKAGATHYAYCGCPEGKGYDESGEKGVYKLELIKGNIVNSEFMPVATRMYIDEEVDVSGAHNYDEILQEIMKKYKGEKHIYRFTLTGECEFSFDTAVLEEKIEAFLVTVRDNTRPCIDFSKASDEFSLKGLFLKYALKDKENLSDEEFNDALKAGLYYIEKEENNEN